MSMYGACWNSWRNFKSKIKTRGHGRGRARASEAATCEASTRLVWLGGVTRTRGALRMSMRINQNLGSGLWGEDYPMTELKWKDLTFSCYKNICTHEPFFFDHWITMQANHIWIAIIFRIGSCHGEGQEGPRGHGAHELPIPGLQSHDEVRVQKQLVVL